MYFPKLQGNICVICTLNELVIVDFLRHFLGKQMSNYDDWQQSAYTLSLVLNSARAHRNAKFPVFVSIHSTGRRNPVSPGNA